MKKYVLIIVSLMVCLCSAAQCLGGDCSIKGRNKAARQKAVRMTGNRKVGKVKKAKYKGKAFSPYSNSRHKSGGGGFDPFANARKRKTVKGGYSNWDNGRKGRPKSGRTQGTWRSREKVKGGGQLSGGKANNNWDQMSADVQATPLDAPEAKPVRSWSEFGSSSHSMDVSYEKPHQWRYGFYYGTVLESGNTTKHYLSDAKSKDVIGGEIALEWPTLGKRLYNHHWNLPTLGLGLSYLHLGDENKLGSTVNLFPYASVPIVRSKHLDINLSAGMGLSYVTKWDKTGKSDFDGTDCQGYDHPLIGSPVNLMQKVGLGFSYRPVFKANNAIDDQWAHWTLFAEACLIHIDNGGILQPNKGIAVAGGEIGLKYTPEIPDYPVRQKTGTMPHSRTLDIGLAGGIKQGTHLSEDIQGTANLNAALMWQALNVWRTGFGLDLFYDGTYSRDYMPCRHDIYDGKYDKGTLTDQFRGGVFWGNEITFGRVAVLADAGYYLYDNIKADGENWYWRWGMKYHFGEKWYAVGSVKQHKLKADLLTIGLGYSLY
ncbi:MAG: hypothetical protein K6D57_05350 [Paludibacteraceae bacterium]|nr:hypothetical protein [Paludibacteraceae bacterium]